MIENLLNRGIAALKAGRKAEARGLLAQLVEQEPRHELGWLWLSGAVDTDEDRRVCLENVLAINPNNDLAQRGLETLQRSSPRSASGPAGSTDAGRPRPAEGYDGGADEDLHGFTQIEAINKPYLALDGKNLCNLCRSVSHSSIT